MKPTVFIDGEAGTTGLQIRTRLAQRADLNILALGESERKSASARSEAINSCDFAILCLPDEAAREAVSLVKNPSVRIIDASSAHRNHPEWVYGFAEMSDDQQNKIRAASRVSNPGCYPTGAIAILRPLIDRKVVPPGYPVVVQAISGYSGGGRQVIEMYEDRENPDYTEAPVLGYGLSLEHKHIAEMETQSGLSGRPIFVPLRGNFRQGILLLVGFHHGLIGADSGDRIRSALVKHYQEKPFVRVADEAEARSSETLDAQTLNGTDELVLHVFSNESRGQTVVAAIYDNLGKGASGAAVQNLDLMLTGR